MRDRITTTMLERKIKELNTLVGQNPEPYTRRENGSLKGNVGTYFLSGVYGGVNVERMATEGGAITHPILDGYHTKRELWNMLTTLIHGINIGITLDQSNEGSV